MVKEKETTPTRGIELQREEAGEEKKKREKDLRRIWPKRPRSGSSPRLLLAY